MKHENRKEKGNNQDRPTRARKPYAAPRLIEYGTVAKLTANTGTSMGDASAKMVPCL